MCLMSGTPIAGDYIKAEGKAGRMGARLMAIVAEGERGRVYLAADARDGGGRATGEADVEAGGRVTARRRSRFQRRRLRTDDIRRPLHPPPARGADDLLRPGAGGARAGEARRAGRRPARRRQAPRATAAPAPPPTPMRWRCIWHSQSTSWPIDSSTICTWISRTRLRSSSTFRAPGYPDDLGLREANPLRRCSRQTSYGAVEWIGEVIDELASRATAGTAHASRCASADHVSVTRSSPPTRPTTTISATPTCRTSSTSGCAAR